jgi:hypothetical protein
MLIHTIPGTTHFSARILKHFEMTAGLKVLSARFPNKPSPVFHIKNTDVQKNHFV